MWLFFGIVAIGAALMNLKTFLDGKNPEVFRYISLSFTALTLCDFYGQNKIWVMAEDWGALADCVPSVSTALWVLVVLSIMMNGLSLVKAK